MRSETKTVTDMVEAYAGDNNMPVEAVWAWLEDQCYDEDSDLGEVERCLDGLVVRYHGEWSNEAEFLENLLEKTGELDSIPHELREHIDFYGAWYKSFRYEFVALERQASGVFIFERF